MCSSVLTILPSWIILLALTIYLQEKKEKKVKMKNKYIGLFLYLWFYVDNGGKFADVIIDSPGKFATGINNTIRKLVLKFADGVVDRSGKFDAGVVGTGHAPWPANISANFRKKLKQSLWDTLGLGGNWSWKKTRSKNLVTLSLWAKFDSWENALFLSR
jgi:hypothetical protein